MNPWIDISRPVDDTLVTWPGHSRPQHQWQKSLAAGDHCNLSHWQLSAHSGTHMDAPLHFIVDGKSIDQLSPEVFIGECQLIDLTESPAFVFDETQARRYAGVERLLIKTSHSQRSAAGYAPHDALFSVEAASILLAAGLVLLGTDRLSVDGSRGASFDLHHRLLGAGCVIVEGLALSEVAKGAYFLSATPLRLTGAEASPVRALVRYLGT
jgi:arylformamidase